MKHSQINRRVDYRTKPGVKTGEPYRTRLEPPPADAAVSHEPRVGVEVV